MKYLLVALVLLSVACQKNAETPVTQASLVRVSVSRSLWGYAPTGNFARFYFDISNTANASRIYMHPKFAQDNRDFKLVDGSQYFDYNSLCDICFTAIYQVEIECKDGSKATIDNIIVTH